VSETGVLMTTLGTAVTLIWVGGVAYVGSYLKKKAENLATHEDLQKLTEQVESIKAEISDKVWNRQRQWEMKRDALFAIMEALTQAADATSKLAWYLKQFREKGPEVAEQEREMKQQHLDAYAVAIDRYDEKRRVASLVCTKATVEVFLQTSQEIRLAADQIKKGPFNYLEIFSPIQQAIVLATSAARQELGMPPLNDAERMEA
jgi:hypothetical protein